MTFQSILVDYTAWQTCRFYNLPEMDIDGNGVPDQWNNTPSSNFILKNEDKVMRVEKVIAGQYGFIRSRALNLKPNTKYKIDMVLDNEKESPGIQYRYYRTQIVHIFKRQ